ncbi:MAG: hypothetical protein KC550_02855 [Nanoarchaeota archaeon]|nr:hypothetical protein [Nanoarchaeota archaeon]
MSDTKSIRGAAEFYKEFREGNPYLIMGLIIITFGLYIINWIYLRNREFIILDKYAPDPNRGAVILMIIPFALFFIMQILKVFFFGYDSLFLGIVEVVLWTLVSFLVLKYILDFCLTFGRITRTSGIFWFTMFFLGFLGIIGIIQGFIWTIPLIFFTIIVVPAMQAQMNVFFKRFSMRKEKILYYDS